MNLYTAAILSFILFFGCTVSLGLSYDEEQLELQKDESKSRELVQSFTNGQFMFLLVGSLGGISAVICATLGIIDKVVKGG